MCSNVENHHKKVCWISGNHSKKVCLHAFYERNLLKKESIIASSLNKEGYETYFYRSKDSTIELDFIIRYRNEILPLEVKTKKGRAISLNQVLRKNNEYIKHGIKFANANIGYANNILTLPHFLSFLLKRFLEEYDF